VQLLPTGVDLSRIPEFQNFTFCFFKLFERLERSAAVERLERAASLSERSAGTSGTTGTDFAFISAKRLAAHELWNPSTYSGQALEPLNRH